MTVELKKIRRIYEQVSAELKQSALHPVLQKVLSHRQIKSPEEITYSLKNLISFDNLMGIDTAVNVIINAIKTHQKILIVGDFDADGATSTAVCYRALKMLGHSTVSYLVPNRFDFGYGLSPELVAVACKDKPELLITVDNGISSIQGVAAAREAGVDVIVTDHHLAGAELPDANAIVNPNQPGCRFASKNLAGVGVIFYLMLAVRAKLREESYFNETLAEPNMAHLLDLVALGTVADVVPLDENNRILVSQGLKRMLAGKACVGIEQILSISGRNIKRIVASDLGFAIGPRLNAAGRLDDMSLGIECLITDDVNQAAAIAEQLDQLNKNRREIEHEMQQQANKSLKYLEMSINSTKLPYGISLYNAQWHQGVVGILASRIKDKYNRPAIIFANDNASVIKGSARSIKGLHIRDVLELISSQNPGLIIKFGGHAMAAGLSLNKSDFKRFEVLFNAAVEQALDKDALQGVIESDGELNAGDFNLTLAEAIRNAGPWGQSFSEPVFDGEFEVIDWRVVGEKHLKMELQAEDADKPISAIAFNSPASKMQQSEGFIRAAYRLDVNEFRNRKTAQLMIEYYEPM
ncbi:Single-stranded-DNA-specific exonuclease RecJ [hydrothermal vent metagenome]|uniref:Single-stranded-DNA-specific exonuclease RecJ n=1 Tax=hydrothermal vent metagenome TaxID=652676 RepID=A0A3B0XZ53_9ZZZZ